MNVVIQIHKVSCFCYIDDDGGMVVVVRVKGGGLSRPCQMLNDIDIMFRAALASLCQIVFQEEQISTLNLVAGEAGINVVVLQLLHVLEVLNSSIVTVMSCPAASRFLTCATRHQLLHISAF